MTEAGTSLAADLAAVEGLPPGRLINADLAPTPPDRRTWNTWHLAALWVGMSVCIPTYMLAASMIESGMTWLVPFLADVIIKIPCG